MSGPSYHDFVSIARCLVDSRFIPHGPSTTPGACAAMSCEKARTLGRRAGCCPCGASSGPSLACACEQRGTEGDVDREFGHIGSSLHVSCDRIPANSSCHHYSPCQPRNQAPHPPKSRRGSSSCEYLESLAGLWDSLTRKEQREVLHITFADVLIDVGEVIAVKPNRDFVPLFQFDGMEEGQNGYFYVG
jgi:hypothetical protein